MNKVDSYIHRFLQFFVPSIFLIPFVVNADYYFPFITPRNFLFRIIITIALALYLFLYFRNKEKYSLGQSKVLLVYFSFAIILTISSLINGDFLYSFWSNYERMEGLLGLYYVIALFVLILGLYRRKKAWLDLLRVSVWSSFMMAIIALSQHWGINLFIESSGGARVTGTTGNAIYLAVYALFNFCFALYLLLKHKNIKPKLELWLFYALDILLIFFELFGNGKGILAGIFSDIRLFLLFIIPQIFVSVQYYFYNTKKTIKYSWTAYFGLIVLLNFLALFNSQTRGVLMGMFVASIVVSVFLLFSKYINKKIKYLITTALVFIILFSSSIFVFKNNDFIQSNNTLRRIANISISDTTAETRLLTWQLSLEGFKEKSIFGWGEENFYVVFNKYFPNKIYKNAGSRVWFDRPHNVFLQQLVHGGVFGFLTYLAIFIFAFRNLWRHYKKTHDPITISVLGGLLIAYLVQNFFVFDSLNSYIPMIILLSVSVFISRETKNILVDKRNNNISAISIALFVFILGLSLNIPQMNANRNFISQYQDLRQNIGKGAYQKEEVDNLLDTMNSQYFGKFELRQVYSEFVASLIRAKILSPIETKYFIDTAETEMLASIAQQPSNVRQHSFLLNVYSQAAALDPYYSQAAIDLIENKAIPLSPTRIQLYYFLGQFYMNLGQNDKGVASFIKAKELAPSVFDSYLNLIITALSADDVEKANKYLAEMRLNVLSISPENYARVFRIYDHFGYKNQVENLQ